MDVLLFLSSPVTWLVTTVTIVYLLYRNGTSTFSYFKDQGIPGPKPMPYVGTMWGIWKQNYPKNDRKLAKKYGRTFGCFDGTCPNLYTIDAELIKSIFIKDFDHFINRREFKASIKIVRKMIGLMANQEWKDVRSSITPAFTTGKIKQMSVLIKERSDLMVSKFRKIAETEGKIDGKHQFNIFAMDVIARCAFGLTIDNLGEKDDLFLKRAKEVFSNPMSKSPLVLLLFVFPNVMAKLGEKVFQSEGFKFFFDLLEDLIKQRANSSEKYHDFIEIATETIMKYTKEVDGQQVPMWSREEIDEIVIAQSSAFMLAGFDTTSTTLANAVFLLARNPQVQEKLFEEIMKKHETFEELNHDMILDFPYVDQVVHEVLRMFPTAPRIERCCNKDISYKGIHIKKGIMVTVPSYALHYDEGYYPEPNRFNPDRWSPDSEIKPDPYSYMPFGLGPRNCIGMRFALEELKIALCNLVKNFRFFPVPETPMEMQFEDGFLATIQQISSTVGIESR